MNPDVAQREGSESNALAALGEHLRPDRRHLRTACSSSTRQQPEHDAAQADGMLAQISCRAGRPRGPQTGAERAADFHRRSGNERSEDAIIAYTFDKFLKTQDPTWPLLLPMVKSAVRAMDTPRTSYQDHRRQGPDQDFVVTGGSKRGWILADRRCRQARPGHRPIVIDVLNMAQMQHTLPRTLLLSGHRRLRADEGPRPDRVPNRQSGPPARGPLRIRTATRCRSS